jgi:hypothetical protein
MPSSILNSDDGVISGTSGLKSSGGDDGNLVFQSKGTETARINTDKQIVAAAGTASLPVITTTGDLNTGIFFPAADTIAFGEGGAEAMRIDSSGNVGIGTTSPGFRLDVSTGDGTVAKFLSTSATGLVRADATGASTRGGAFDAFQNGVLRGRVGVSGTWAGDTSSDFAVASEANVRFYSGGSGTESARITSGGNLLVGTTALPSTLNGGAAFEAGAASGRTILQLGTTSTAQLALARFYNPNGSVGSIETNGSATAYVTSSDYRLKENIAPMTGALATVAQLKPCTYTWKFDGSAGQGFIAHELQEIVPDCVSGEKDAVETYTDEEGNEQTRIKPQGIDTSFLVATLTAAIQELKAELDAAKERIAALEQA